MFSYVTFFGSFLNPIFLCIFFTEQILPFCFEIQYVYMKPHVSCVTLMYLHFYSYLNILHMYSCLTFFTITDQSLEAQFKRSLKVLLYFTHKHVVNSDQFFSSNRSYNLDNKKI